MNQKQFNIVAIVTLVLVVWSIVLASSDRRVDDGFVRGQPLVDYFDPQRISRLEVSKGDEKVQIVRQGEQFVVENRSGYPADGGRINNLIKSCFGIHCVAEIGDAKEAHAELAVAGGPETTVVRFLEGDNLILGILVGKATDDSGEYVRLEGSDTVYAAEKSVDLPTDPLDYVDRTILELDSANIAKVELSSAEGRNVLIRRTADDIQLEGIPEGKVAKGSDFRQVFNAATSLRFKDFLSEAALADVEFDKKYVVTTEAGAQYVFQLGKKDDKQYCKVAADFVGDKTIDVEKAKDDPELQKKNEAKLAASEAVLKFKPRHESWVYELESWSAGNMTKSFDELIEEDKAFLKVDENDIAVVQVSHGEETYSVASPKKGEVVLQDIPDGKQAKGLDHHLVFTALTTLKWDERKQPDDAALADVKFDTTYSMTTRSGARYTFDLAQKDGSSWCKARADYVEPPATGSGEAVEAANGREKGSADIAKGAVAKFNTRHEGHVYKVTPGVVSNMTKKLDELLTAAGERPTEIAASHILIGYEGAERSEVKDRTKEEARKKAEDLLAEVLESPDKFADFAREHSNDPGGPDNGGDLGTFKFEAMTPPFSEAAFALKVGEVSGVVETGFGFHIIQRTK